MGGIKTTNKWGSRKISHPVNTKLNVEIMNDYYKKHYSYIYLTKCE